MALWLSLCREGLAVQRRIVHVHIRQSKASLTHQEEREKNAPLKLVDMVHRKHVVSKAQV